MISRRRVMVLACLFAAAWTSVSHAQGAFRAGPPQPMKLQTRDGVNLAITYYPSAVKKDATPVVLLHDDKDTQGIFSSLATRLQSPGEEDKYKSFAVVTVDLRGHGDSTNQANGDGATRTLDAAKLGKDDIAAMAHYDMEAVRSFLVGKNDAEELNLNKLCLVGVGLGATVAVNWAAQDWSVEPLLVGKQGQDVKALVLVSPEWKYRGIAMQQAMAVPALKQHAAWMLIYGAESGSAKADEKRIYKLLDRYHPEPTARQDALPRDLVEVAAPSSLQGSRLLNSVGKPLEDQIIQFLAVHVQGQEHTWSKRRNRLK